MYLLYADESGTEHDPNLEYFVLAGFCVHERQGWWIAKELDQIASRFNPGDPSSVELHGSPMLAAKGIWHNVSKVNREKAIEDCLNVLCESHPSTKVFASVIHKPSLSSGDAVEIAFEQLSSRFDMYLSRLHKNKDTQRGVIIFDKSRAEPKIQSLATDFRTIGNTWGILRNFAEVPLFLDSKASRLIQLADLVAYSVFRRYERGDNRFFSIFESRFDSVGGIVHGLHVQ